MARSSSSGGIGIGTILALIFLWNVVFDDEDTVDKVTIKESDQPPIEVTIDEVRENIKETIELVREAAKEEYDNYKEEQNQDEKKIPTEKITPDKEPETKGMKKL